jgi:hypothetical protein
MQLEGVLRRAVRCEHFAGQHQIRRRLLHEPEVLGEPRHADGLDARSRNRDHLPLEPLERERPVGADLVRIAEPIGRPDVDDEPGSRLLV